MALRSVYAGRANENTLVVLEINGELYIAYASGQRVSIKTRKRKLAQVLVHNSIQDTISHLAASSHKQGSIAVVCGQRVSLFRVQATKSSGRRDDTDSQSTKKSTVSLLSQKERHGQQKQCCWAYCSHFDLDRDNVVACQWLGWTQILVAYSDSTLELWSFDESKSEWRHIWRQDIGTPANQICSAKCNGEEAGRIFATISPNSPLVKVWQLEADSDNPFIRFQYIAHPSAVFSMVWLDAGRHEDGVLSLGTITEDGQFYIWKSAAKDDIWRPQNTCYGIKFALISMVDLSPPGSISGDQSGSSKALVAAGTLITTGQSKLTVESDSQAGKDQSSTSSTAPESAEEAIEDECLPTDSNTTYVYAMYTDGSLDMWEVSYNVKTFVVPRPKHVLYLPPTEITLARPRLGLYQSLMWGSRSDGPYLLAVTDMAGHTFVLNISSIVDSRNPTFSLYDLWDGHREPIFHISVDPYGHRLATHSVEGELLIWNPVSHTSQNILISRKMALEETQIRTIAWAPTKKEFIAATDNKVYRMCYDPDTEEWTPCHSSLPQLGAYDRIFTFPAEPDSEENDRCTDSEHRDTGDSRCCCSSYYISTIVKESKTMQTWHITADGAIEFVNRMVLEQAVRFNRASRVMPVAHPFFSRDNIMATFDTGSGSMRIWGIRTSPEFVWFCSKQHKLPCMNVDMIRYNSIDKAAIVSSTPDGSQVITIWVFSSASRASSYLPAGTIYPEKQTDRVREIRWHLTPYAQTYLGIQWDDRVDIYCQQRNLDDAWLCVLTIPASDFAMDSSSHIGSFSFTYSGHPILSIDRQLIQCSSDTSGGKTLGDVAYEEHGQLSFIHPRMLTELMSWEKMDTVKDLLAKLYDYMRELEIDSSRVVALPVIPLQDLLSTGSSEIGSSGKKASQDTGVRARYSSLFGSSLDTAPDTEENSSEAPDFEGFTQDKASYLTEKLAEIKIHGISPIEQAELMSIVATISASQVKDQPIDSMGIRYVMKLQLLELENRRTRSSANLSYRELNWAQHSSSQAILLQLCLRQNNNGSEASSGLTWESARHMGIFMWLRDISSFEAEVEKMARNVFVSEGRDPTKCAIFYLALKKQRLLYGLWRTAHTHPEHSKMVAFMANDFSQPRWKTAAAKNAYVLLSRQRYLDAATFFLLSGKLSDAAAVCVTQLKDPQMAITICRCYEGDSGPILKQTLWRYILPDAFKRQDRWLASLAFGIINRYDLVLQSLTDNLSKLATQIDVDMDESTVTTSSAVGQSAAVNVLDTELLILYRSLLDYSPKYRAPLVTQAELIAQTMTIFECLGIPIMSLVVLEWWRRELYSATKNSTTLLSTMSQPSKPAATSDTINTGMLGMNAFSGTKNDAAVDPLASGALSMDSFGSMFAGMSLGNSSQKLKKPPDATNSNSSPPQPSAVSRQQPSTTTTDRKVDDSSLRVEIEDTPIQYACRVTLALQIIEFISRAQTQARHSTTCGLDLEKEKRTVAGTLRLSMAVFP